MRIPPNRLLLLVILALLSTGCGTTARLPVAAGTGPDPVLPPPRSALFPMVNIANAKPWPSGTMPRPAAGLAVNAFARNLDHPRWLYVLPNGDVLVAETNTPPQPQSSQGLLAKIRQAFMKRAGSGAKPSANRISLLRDRDGDGVAELRAVFLDGLNSPFGMALIGNDFYVANTDAVQRFPYTQNVTRIEAPGTHIAALPAGAINYHWTKSLIATPDGAKLYVGVGSNSNIGEKGLEAEEGRAALWEIDARTGNHRIFAAGLRNPSSWASTARGIASHTAATKSFSCPSKTHVRPACPSTC